MKKLIIVLIAFLISCTDTPTEPVRPNIMNAKINRIPYSFIIDLAVLPGDGSASISGTYCVAGRIPRNLSISFWTPDLASRAYSIPINPTVGELTFIIVDMDGDAVTGRYRPINAEAAKLTVNSYARDTGRFTGLFDGVFAVDSSSNPEFRYYPDTLYVENGLFDVYLFPINEFQPIWEYPCFPS